MRIIFKQKLQRIAGYLELIVALIITIVIAISIISMIYRIALHPLEIHDADTFYEFMNSALSLIVGIEFLKMIIVPKADNIIETLLFAVSRHIILDHGIPVMIVGVICIVLLFFTKKYLFSNFVDTENYTFRANVPVKTVDNILEITLPTYKENETLGEYISRQLENEDKVLETGVTVRTENSIFQVGKLDSNRKIKKIYVHKKTQT